MDWELLNVPLVLPAFMLVTARLSGIVITSPVIGSPVIPRQVKVLLVLAMSAMIFPLARSSVPAGLTLGTALFGMANELMVGLVIGVGFSLIFSGAAIASRLVGQQAGLAAGALFDPVFESSSTAVGELYFFFTIVVFFAIGGHHALLTCLLDTFETTPLMTFQLTGAIVAMLNDLVAGAFSFGLRMAGPVLIAMFLASITMAFVGRTMPQLNILSVGFAIRVLIGIWIIAVSIAAVNEIFSETFWDFADTVRDAFP